jgi:hypothetical protein
MFSLKIRRLLLSMALLVVAESSRAEVLTFEGISPAGTFVLAPAEGISGYLFSNSLVFSSNYYLDGQWGPGPYPGNGSDVLVVPGSGGFRNASNTPFSMISMDLGTLGSDGPVFTVTITGNRADGSSVEYFQVFFRDEYDLQFHNVVLSDFTDLTSVFIQTTNGAVQIDNLVLNAMDTVPPASPVPEPETYGILLGGLGLIGFVARRRKSRA